MTAPLPSPVPVPLVTPFVRSRRRLGALLALVLLFGVLAVVGHPPGGPPAAAAAVAVPAQTCRDSDPNVVHGICLRYRGAGGVDRLTWIGTYRAADGRVFFCIDFLYSSDLPRGGVHVSTGADGGLRNQLGRRVGRAEVAALNQVVSTWAPTGSSGRDERDAAIALIVRQVMGDGVHPDGTVVYPQGLRVGGRVRPPAGGLGGAGDDVGRRVLRTAQTLWDAASRLRGPYTVELRSGTTGPLTLGRERVYALRVRSAAGHAVPGVRVRLACTGPVACPASLRSGSSARRVVVRPLERGRVVVRAEVRGPAADAVLYRVRDWRDHDGETARPVSVQRGWIAQRNRAAASVSATALVRKARPRVITHTSRAVVRPGARIHDLVVLSRVPDGYAASVVADLHGPFAVRPGEDDCTETSRVGRVRFDVLGSGRYRTPSIRVRAPGYYTWVQRLPADEHTRAHVTRCGIVAETTRVRPLVPRVSTAVSDQRSEVGDTLRDTVVLAGLRRTSVTLRWRLAGPVLPSPDGTCRQVDWEGAPTLDRGRLAAPGDGTYRTPPSVVARRGCHSYEIVVPPTSVSEGAVSPLGLVAETSLVERRRPRVSTVASHRETEVGVRVHDRIRVTGLHDDDRVGVAWRLLGPVAPRGGACTSLTWGAARVVARGEFVAVGPGSYRTGSTVLRAAGCYTYAVHLRGTSATEPAVSPPGLVPETMRADRRRPTVATAVSTRSARVGVGLRDEVRITGLGPHDRVDVAWRLLGPAAPQGSGVAACRGLDWSDASTAARGSYIQRGDGVRRTDPARLREPGCYTYTVALAGTAATEPAVSPPGLPAETALVTRQPLPGIPEVPTGPVPTLPGVLPLPPVPPVRYVPIADGTRFTPTTRAEPRYLHREYRGPSESGASVATTSGRLVVPRLGIDLPVVGVGVRDGVVAVPDDRGRVGWLRSGAHPGDAVGASLLSGHTSDGAGRLGALRAARVGDVLDWTGPDGVRHRYEVTGLARHDRRRGLPTRLFRTDGPHVVHLVTCDTRARRPDGRRYFRDNLVVTAVPVG